MRLSRDKRRYYPLNTPKDAKKGILMRNAIEAFSQFLSRVWHGIKIAENIRQIFVFQSLV